MTQSDVTRAGAMFGMWCNTRSTMPITSEMLMVLSPFTSAFSAWKSFTLLPRISLTVIITSTTFTSPSWLTSPNGLPEMVMGKVVGATFSTS